MSLPKPYFKNITDVGSLDIEHIIFEADYPVLFTCRDKFNNLYLCLCCDIRHEQRWIISKTTSEIVIDMLSDKITLYDSLKSPFNKNYVVIWSYKSQEENVSELQFSEIDELDLPAQGEYIEAEEDEFEEYINELKLKEKYELVTIDTSLKNMTLYQIPKITIDNQYRELVSYGGAWVCINRDNSHYYITRRLSNMKNRNRYINNQTMISADYVPIKFSESLFCQYSN